MTLVKVWNKRDPNTPKDAVYVGRPSKWGNPYSHLPSRLAIEVPTREDAIAAYEEWIMDKRPDLIEDARKELRGKHLVCWCAPKPCHADVLLEIANSDPE